jgi:hypothetical protein
MRTNWNELPKNARDTSYVVENKSKRYEKTNSPGRERVTMDCLTFSSCAGLEMAYTRGLPRGARGRRSNVADRREATGTVYRVSLFESTAASGGRKGRSRFLRIAEPRADPERIPAGRLHELASVGNDAVAATLSTMMVSFDRLSKSA